MVPQFARLGTRQRDLLIGLSLFAIGFAKKICLADPLAPAAAAVFDTAAPSGELQLLWAWLGALAYTMQIYFDFSGYSDMALGLGRMFGIRLPINFYSPYKATNIADFWRRWHMTLSRFLREYVYIPLGGNRRGEARRLVNLATVMLVGGLWHGSNWTFVVWGGLHGLYLMVHQLWRRLGLSLPPAVAGAITFVAVIAAWVPFRSHDMTTAMTIWHAMLGLNGIEGDFALASLGDEFTRYAVAFNEIGPTLAVVGLAGWLLALYAACVLLPNTTQFFRLRHPWPGGRDFRPVYRARPTWLPRPAWGAIIGAAFGFALLMSRQLPQEFLYWRF